LNRFDYLNQKIANGFQITSEYHENNDRQQIVELLSESTLKHAEVC
jgi:hypothetical protein